MAGSIDVMTLAAIACTLPLVYLLLGARPRADEGPPGAWTVNDALALLTPLALFALLNHHALGSWWTHDDPCLLRSLVRNGIWSHFAEPQAWRQVSATLLMPWIMASFGFDRALFGLEPSAFYVHQLLSFAVLFLVAHALLRRFLAPAFAGLALSIFAISLPTFAVAQQLMNRTYVEGLALALGSVLLYHRSLRRESAAWALAGAGVYALAATAKEVFVPLAVVLPFLPVGGIRLRLRHWAPYALVALGYAVWRGTMLAGGRGLTAYGVFADAIPSLTQVAASFGFAGSWLTAEAGAICLAAVVLVGRAWPRCWPFMIAVVVASIAPLAALGSMLAPRHAFVPSFAAVVLVAAALQRLRRLAPGALGGALTAALALALVTATWRTTTSAGPWRSHAASVRHYRAEGSFVLGNVPGALLMTSLNDASYLSCMRDLRPAAAAGPGFCGDACFCARSFPENERWAFDGERVAPVARSIDADCASARDLDADVRYDPETGMLLWRAGPRADARYAALLVFDPRLPAISVPIPIPPRGELPFWLDEPLGVVVRYEDSAGRIAYSRLHQLVP